MMVEITGARFTSEYAETTYYFCSSGCKRSFDKEPQNIFNWNLPRCENPGVGTTTIFNED
jgi:YHS domain-containing protein